MEKISKQSIPTATPVIKLEHYKKFIIIVITIQIRLNDFNASKTNNMPDKSNYLLNEKTKMYSWIS